MQHFLEFLRNVFIAYISAHFFSTSLDRFHNFSKLFLDIIWFLRNFSKVNFMFPRNFSVRSLYFSRSFSKVASKFIRKIHQVSIKIFLEYVQRVPKNFSIIFSSGFFRNFQKITSLIIKCSNFTKLWKKIPRNVKTVWW